MNLRGLASDSLLNQRHQNCIFLRILKESRFCIHSTIYTGSQMGITHDQRQ